MLKSGVGRETSRGSVCNCRSNPLKRGRGGGGMEEGREGGKEEGRKEWSAGVFN